MAVRFKSGLIAQLAVELGALWPAGRTGLVQSSAKGTKKIQEDFLDFLETSGKSRKSSRARPSVVHRGPCSQMTIVVNSFPRKIC
jgi:hypothetical protein